MKRFFSAKEASVETLEPVERMIGIMQDAGIKAFEAPTAWENCLCALVLALDPRCRTYMFMEALPHDRERYSETDVLNATAHLGYFSRKITVDLEALDKRLFPCLFIPKDGHPMILIEHEDDMVRIYRNGGISYLRIEQLTKEAGTAYIFERYDETRPSTSKFVRAGTEYSWFRALLSRFKGTFAQILSAGLVLNIISLITPLFVMMIYNRVIATSSLDVLPMIVAGMVLAIGFEFILRGIRSRGLSWIAARMDNIVGNRIFAHLVGLSPSLIERASVAAQIARVRTFESIRDFFCSSVFLSLIEIPFVILAALAIWAIAGPLVLVPVLLCSLYVALFYTVYKKVRTSIRLSAKVSSARQQFTIEALEKLRGIRTYGLTSLWQSKFRDLSGKEMMAQFHLGWLGMVGETLAHALTLLAAVATIGYGAHMIWQGTLGTGALVASMILVWRILTPFYSVCTIIPRVEQLRNSILQVNKLMDLDTEAQISRTASRLPRIRGDIAFTGVSLRYGEEGDPVFSGLTLEARPGDLVVITGDNGAGKSSVLKMLKGLYKPLAGSVQIDGFDIRQLDAPDLRRQIAYVPQQADFFHGTIWDNLRISNPIANRHDIETAAELAGVHHDIMSLPDGYGTMIDRYKAALLPANIGLKLSLARLYLHTSPILLIDEIPNMILSDQAGKNLRDYLARIKGNRTCLMVSYREDIMRMADTLVHMRCGQAPQVGKTETMINKIMEAA